MARRLALADLTLLTVDTGEYIQAVRCEGRRADMKGYLLIAVTCLTACQQSRVDLEAEEAALLAAAEAYHSVSHKAEWVNLTESEMHDVLILPADAPAIRGVEAARDFFDGTPADFEMRYEDPVVEVSRSGDMGYSLARARVRSTVPDGIVVEDQIRDFHLWKKQDGEWKIAIDIWNSASP